LSLAEGLDVAAEAAEAGAGTNPATLVAARSFVELARN
jgi:hypothetical protein